MMELIARSNKSNALLNLKHVFTNLMGSALPIAIILVTVPTFLHLIGAEKYGVLSIVWLVFGYFGILDFGVSRAVTNAVSRNRSDAARKTEIIWSAGALNLLTGVAVLGLCGLAYALWVWIYPTSDIRQIEASLPFILAGIPVVMLTASLNGALDGDERFRTANTLQVIGSAIFQLAPLAVAAFVSVELNTLIDTVIVCRFILLLLYIAVAVHVFELGRAASVKFAAMRDLLRFGSTVAIVNIVDPIFTRLDQLIVARYAGPEAVASYNIAINSVGRLSILPLAMSRSIFPKLSSGSIEQHFAELANLKSRLLVIWTVICIAALASCDIVFDLWLQNSISPAVTGVAKVFIVGLWANCLSILPYTALQANGRSGRILIAHLLEMPFYLSALLFLTISHGAQGAAGAYALRSVADYLILWKMCGYKLTKQKSFLAVLCLVAASATFMLRTF
jgi:O-antigen/teichoic acid export membrane protein